MKIKIVLHEPYRGMTNGWTTRIIGFLTELAKEHQLLIYAPGDTALLKNEFVEAEVCKSTSEQFLVTRYTPLKYLYAVCFKTDKRIYLPGFEFYPDFENLLKKSESIPCDAGLSFGLTSFIHYGRYFGMVPVICDFCDSTMRHLVSFRKASVNPVKKLIYTLDSIHLRKIKRKFIPQDLTITAITDNDAEYIKRALKKNKIYTLSNGVHLFDSENINDRYLHSKWCSGKMLFCGSLDYLPNVNAIQYIIKMIWPSVKREIPDAELEIIGRNPLREVTDLVQAKPGITLSGNVRNVFEYYKKAKVLLSPMFLGGGMKNKVLEALGSATPVITNLEGITGIKTSNYEFGYIAENKQDIINSVIKIYKDNFTDYKKLCINGYNLSKEYSWESVGKKLLAILNDLKVQNHVYSPA